MVGPTGKPHVNPELVKMQVSEISTMQQPQEDLKSPKLWSLQPGEILLEGHRQPVGSFLEESQHRVAPTALGRAF